MKNSIVFIVAFIITYLLSTVSSVYPMTCKEIIINNRVCLQCCDYSGCKTYCFTQEEK